MSAQRVRPGRFIPQFEGMRVEHDDHRRRVPMTPWHHWTDCDACLAIAVVDRLYEQLAQRPAFTPAQHFALFVWECGWIAAVAGAATWLLSH